MFCLVVLRERERKGSRVSGVSPLRAALRAWCFSLDPIQVRYSTMALWFLVLALSALATTGGAIECYECPKDSHKCGGDGFDVASLQKRECSIDSVYESLEHSFPGISGILGLGNLKSTITQVAIPLACIKIDKTNQDSGKVTTIRTCTVAKHDKTDPCEGLTKTPALAGDKVTFCGTCAEDLCNSAPGLSTPSSLAALLFSSAVVYLVAQLGA